MMRCGFLALAISLVATLLGDETSPAGNVYGPKASFNTIEVTTFLILVFIKRYGSKIFPRILRYDGADQRGEPNFYTIYLIVQTRPLHNSAERGEPGSVETAKLDPL